jgi:hypothetical protein
MITKINYRHFEISAEISRPATFKTIVTIQKTWKADNGDTSKDYTEEILAFSQWFDNEEAAEKFIAKDKMFKVVFNGVIKSLKAEKIGDVYLVFVG